MILEEFRSEVRAEFGMIGERFGKIDERFVKVDERFAQIDERFAQIDERFVKIDERFAQIDDRFDKIDERFAQIDERFDKIDERFAKIDKEFVKVRHEMSEGFSRLERLLQVAVESFRDDTRAFRDALLGSREQHQALDDRVQRVEWRMESAETALTVLLRKAGF